MSFRFRVLNKKQSKKIISAIQLQWGAEKKLNLLDEESVFVASGEKLYIATRDIFLLPVGRLRVSSFGVHFAELEHDGIRLTIEGSQIVGPFAGKNVIELSREEAKEWLAGKDVKARGSVDAKARRRNEEKNATGEKRISKGYVIVASNGDFLGCGKLLEDGKVLNFVPKARRIH